MQIVLANIIAHTNILYNFCYSLAEGLQLKMFVNKR